MANGPYYVDQALTTLSQAWKNPTDAYIAEKLFPVMPVDKKTGIYWAYSKDNLVVPSSTVRTGRAKTKEATNGRSLSDFGPLQEHALKDFISKDEYDMYDSPLDPESDAVDFLNEQMLLSEEQDLVNYLGNTSVFTHYSTPGTLWSSNSADPINDIIAAIKAQRGNTPVLPNTIAFGWDVWAALVNHPAVIARYSAIKAALSTDDFMALLAPFGITKVFIGTAQSLTSANATSLGSIWGKTVVLAYVTDTPSLRAVNGGYTLRLRNGKYVDKKDEWDPKGTYVRNNDYYDQFVFAADSFYQLKGVIA